jgi:hypothetical protein
VMWTDEDEMVGIVEERANGGDFFGACGLPRAQGIEADDDERVDITEHMIQRRLRAIVGDTFDFENRMAGLGSHLFGKGDAFMM